MVAALNDTANTYDLKYNLSCVNFSLECILERSTGIDALDKKHILAIHKQFGKGSIDRLRLATFYEKYIHSRYFITPASKHVKGCHAGLDPASSPVLDSRFRGNDSIGIYGCRSNNKTISVLPLNLIDYNLEYALKELSDFSNYVYYGGKHYESILTRFLQCYLSP